MFRDAFLHSPPPSLLSLLSFLSFYFSKNQNASEETVSRWWVECNMHCSIPLMFILCMSSTMVVYELVVLSF